MGDSDLAEQFVVFVLFGFQENSRSYSRSTEELKPSESTKANFPSSSPSLLLGRNLPLTSPLDLSASRRHTVPGSSPAWWERKLAFPHPNLHPSEMEVQG